MEVSYKKLWKLLIDRDLKKKDLAQQANLTGYVMNRLSRSEHVNSQALSSICKALNCTFDDIIEIVDDDKK